MRKRISFFSFVLICLLSSVIEASHFKIVVKKAERKLYLYEKDSLIKTYKIALGLVPIGKKEKQGDRKTPEGDYFITSKNEHSSYYLSLGISYPNIADAERGLKANLITKKVYNTIVSAQKHHRIPPQNTALGGDVFFHGNGTSRDWTWGCVALEDSDVKELFEKIPIGTPVRIDP